MVFIQITSKKSGGRFCVALPFRDSVSAANNKSSLEITPVFGKAPFSHELVYYEEICLKLTIHINGSLAMLDILFTFVRI